MRIEDDEVWETTAVTALPVEWWNHPRVLGDDGYATPCAAVLLQEHRADRQITVYPDGKRTVRDDALQAPYRTRVVWGDPGEPGQISAATDNNGYCCTSQSQHDHAPWCPSTT